MSMLCRRVIPSVALVLGLASCVRPGTSVPTSGSGGRASVVTQSQGEVALRSARVGPERGSLVVVGGGALGPEIIERFIQLAGGKDAPIVVIPTAGGESDSLYGPSCRCADQFRKAGATRVTVLHTYDHATADREEFARTIRDARAVWFPGGRQWRLADSYLGTRTERELHALLERGGVIGGTSAGASIQASFLVRGAVEGNTIVMSEDHAQGFGFLRGVAVDQHVVARNRLNDLPEVLKAHPDLLGIGIDEGTAIVVRGDQFEVLGRSRAFVYGGTDQTDAGAPYVSLRSGDRYDMAARRIVNRAQ